MRTLIWTITTLAHLHDMKLLGSRSRSSLIVVDINWLGADQYVDCKRYRNSWCTQSRDLNLKIQSCKLFYLTGDVLFHKEDKFPCWDRGFPAYYYLNYIDGLNYKNYVYVVEDRVERPFNKLLAKEEGRGSFAPSQNPAPCMPVWSFGFFYFTSYESFFSWILSQILPPPVRWST